MTRYSSFCVTDWDGDGELDLIVGRWTGQLRFFKGTAGRVQEANGSHNPFSSINVGRRADPFAVDMDGDGRPDLVVKNNAGRLYFFQRGSCKVPFGCGREQDEVKGHCQASGHCSCRRGYSGPDCTQCQPLYFAARGEESLSSVCKPCPGLLSSAVCNRRGRCLDAQALRNTSQASSTLTSQRSFGNVSPGACICNAPFHGADCAQGSCPAGHELTLDPKSPNITHLYPLWESCFPCGQGFYKALPGNDLSCIQCPVGKYQDQKGNSACKLCQAGRYQTDVGSSYCAICGPGEHSSPGAYSCSRCFGCSWWHWPLTAMGCCLVLVLISIAMRRGMKKAKSRRAEQLAGCLLAELRAIESRGWSGEDMVHQLAPVWAQAQRHGCENVCEEVLSAFMGALRSCCEDLPAIRRIKERSEQWGWQDATLAAQDLLLEARRESELRGIALEHILHSFEHEVGTKVVQREWRQIDGTALTLDGCLMRHMGTLDAPPREWVAAPTVPPPRDPTFTQMAPILAFGELSAGYGQLCPRDGELHCSIVDGIHRQGSSFRANRFLSWVWGYNLSTACAALRSWRNEQLRVNPAFRPESIAIWWCFFCNNQFRFLQDQARQSTADLSLVFGEVCWKDAHPDE